MSPAYAISSPDAHTLPPSRVLFDEMTAFLASPDALASRESHVEDYVLTQGHEVLRRLLQEHADRRFSLEQRVPVVDQEGVARPIVRRGLGQLHTLVGAISVPHLVYQAPEQACRAPLEATWNLPDDSYSHPLRRRLAEEVARDAFDEACQALRATPGCHVPKRQAEQLSVRAAQDFDAFYAQRTCAAMPKDATLLVLTFDAKGIVVLPRDLRPETRKRAREKAKTAHERPMKRLGIGEKRHRKRMAQVAAVYGLEAEPRTAAEILGEVAANDTPRPKPVNKRVWASVEKEPSQVIEAAFEEALKRDPDRSRTWLALVDGNASQITLVEETARRYQVKITILLDLIHVLEYLWKASYCFHKDGTREAEAWVTERLRMLLRGTPASEVAAGMRRSATWQRLSKRKAVDGCAKYLCGHRKYLDYARALREGWPLATGVIEGACRHLLKDRLEKTGARWSLPGAEAVLKLRALRSSDDFEAYWGYHLEQEYQRNHASRYQDGKVPNPLPGRPALRIVK
jgi:hypothetical protein